MGEALFKIGSLCGDTITPFRYSNTFQVERTTGPDRLRVGPAEAPLSLLYRLASALAAPLYILYVLHTSRCGSRLGRYQSQAMQFTQMNGFMAEFCEFLTDDARHDLWLFAPESNATLVWDRHDLIYAYGPLDEFRNVLKEDLQEGRVAGPPVPHVHLYHPKYDGAERRILRHFEWSWSPLMPDDEQRRSVDNE